MANTLRLLLNENCNRSCEGCCNKDWDLKALPVCTDMSPYDMVILTGGEPMLYPDRVVDAAKQVDPDKTVILYTAKVDDLEALSYVMMAIDGMTITLHEQSDVEPFLRLHERLPGYARRPDVYSLRLNVFDGIVLPEIDLSPWKVKTGIKWIQDCPLPDNEVFMRYQ